MYIYILIARNCVINLICRHLPWQMTLRVESFFQGSLMVSNVCQFPMQSRGQIVPQSEPKNPFFSPFLLDT